MKSIIAFDVSMGKSYMVIYNTSRCCVFEGEILHNKIHFEKLYQRIVALVQQDGQTPEIVFEATGVYSRQLERFMNDHGFPYCLLNPLESKLQTASMRRHKTDKSDAHRLAQTHFTSDRKNKIAQDDYYDQMRSLSRYYHELDQELKLVRSRIHTLLQLTFPEIETLFTGKSELFLNILQLFPHPDGVKQRSKTVIRNRLLANTSKKLAPKTAEKKAIQLLEIAEYSYPAVDEDDIRCEQLKYYAKRCLAILRQREEVIKQMADLSQERKEYQVLMSVPGIGTNTAVRLIAEMGDIHRFKNNKQLNAYAGIDIRRFQSGTILYQDKINRRGNKHLRKVLYFTIQNMIKQRRFADNHFVDYYDKLKTQPYNKRHKVASIACVNKLLKCLFHLITHNLHYDYQRAAGK
ncbi:IS110 family transposase [Fictibacillus enclensis]|uniref:IS110 family transposase n=1 Tax=Fictibacillus enclensis TaxID=1017270 RepID=UPI0025A0A64A|nr:IS110 family transposase [Fictibacillus enclensis]MDM5336552.1 IS110 family transposase [Fictibacillus enclensis]MDM5338779.1 IS110 family transposase [Fictibacillus enclensis]MDM5338847.1 IS110 family transposase [Fictibacillus enclensis]MDM5339341.1 IS110 family transposase [Fictibacillus enclensis]